MLADNSSMFLTTTGTGRAEPVPVELKSGRGGFGKESEARRKGMEMETLRSWLSVKRRRLEQGWKERFQQKISNKYASKNVEKDLHTSQAACFQLDREMVCFFLFLLLYKKSFIALIKSNLSEEFCYMKCKFLQNTYFVQTLIICQCMRYVGKPTNV